MKEKFIPVVGLSLVILLSEARREKLG